MTAVVPSRPLLYALRGEAPRAPRRPLAMWIVIVIPCLLALAGCSYTSYDIEMKTDGAVLERKLTVRYHEPEVEEGAVAVEALADPADAARPAPQEKDDPQEAEPPAESDRDRELKRLAGLYDKRLTPPDSEEHVFLGRFTGNTPDDVGGSGSYTYLTTQMGTASAYVERFRGNDDLAAELDRRLKAADQLVDLVVGWLESELQEEPGLEKLHDFLENDFRRDVRNLVVYGWVWVGGAQGASTDSEQAVKEFAVRVTQYLAERGYFTPQSLPRVLRAVTDATSRAQPKPLLAIVQRAVATKMGVPEDEPVPDRLAFLADEAAITASWDRHLANTDLFRQRLEQWAEERKTNPDVEKPKPQDLVTELGVTASGLHFFLVQDRLKVSLQCPAAPFATNGAWDAKTARVSWSGRIGQRGQPPHNVLPKVLYALWSVPNAEFQNDHFGKTVLAGEELAQYVLWRHGLSDQEAGEWDGFVATLQPGERLVDQLDAFRFTTDPAAPPPGQEETPTLADTPRDLIKQGLKPDSEG